MIAEIITVGGELLIGSTLNTNGPYISQLLTRSGYDVKFHSSVQDNTEDLTKAIELAISRSDIIFLCGGLGPTNDDITKEVLAYTLGLKLVFSEAIWDKIKSYAATYSKNITLNNKKQAYLIEGSTMIPNYKGTAPGEYISFMDKKIFLLPGPPKEFETMAKLIVENYLHQESDKIFIESLNLVQIGESECESRIRKLNLENKNIEINTFAKSQQVEVLVIGRSLDYSKKQNLHEMFTKVIQILTEEFRENLYSYGDMSLEKSLVKKLSLNNAKISFAESITGGLLASKITSVPGSSSVIDESYITYSNNAKIKILNVNQKTIDENGVVSPEVAYEMAKGCYEFTKSTFCISTTGEAGPISSSGVPIGTLCYSIFHNGNELITEKIHFEGDRETVQLRSCKHVLSKLFFLI